MMEKLGAPQTHLGLKEMIKVRAIMFLLLPVNFISGAFRFDHFLQPISCQMCKAEGSTEWSN